MKKLVGQHIGLVFLLLSVTACGQESKNHLSPEQFEKAAAQPGVQLVDVRTPEEFRKGYINGAMNININGSEFKRQVAALDPQKIVLVYCLSGGRSAKAADYMREKGLEVYELKGGIMKWNNMKKPLVQEVPSSEGMTLQQFSKRTGGEKLVLVDFYAPWCAPCRKMAPAIEAIQNKYAADVDVLKIAADDNRALMDSLSVEALPALFLYKNGTQVWKVDRLVSEEEIESAVQKNL